MSVIDKITVVYDLLGREVAVLVNERKAPGSYEVTFSAKGRRWQKSGQRCVLLSAHGGQLRPDAQITSSQIVWSWQSDSECPLHQGKARACHRAFRVHG